MLKFDFHSALSELGSPSKAAHRFIRALHDISTTSLSGLIPTSRVYRHFVLQLTKFRNASSFSELGAQDLKFPFSNTADKIELHDSIKNNECLNDSVFAWLASTSMIFFQHINDYKQHFEKNLRIAVQAEEKKLIQNELVLINEVLTTLKELMSEGKRERDKNCTDYFLTPFAGCFSEYHNPEFQYLFSCEVEKTKIVDEDEFLNSHKKSIRRGFSLELIKRKKSKFQAKQRLVLFALNSGSQSRKMLLINGNNSCVETKNDDLQ